MTLLWANPATNNKFANKHLLIIGGSPTLQQMVDDGYEVFDARVKAYKWRRRTTVEARGLKEKYGGNMEVTSNTLMVLSNGGLASLEAAIINNGYKSDWYSVANGVVFTMDDNDYDSGLVAKVKLDVRALPAGGGYEVWHLDGATVTALGVRTTAQGIKQTRVGEVPDSGGQLGLHFTPTPSELQRAAANLKKQTTKVSNLLPLPSAIGNIKLIDLSFLED